MLLLINIFRRGDNKEDHILDQYRFKWIGAICTLLLIWIPVFTSPDDVGIEIQKDFEMLVVGDSIISGQGLEEKDKFVTLTKNWLEGELFEGRRKVNLKNKSHSGSSVFLTRAETAALNKANRRFDEFFHAEVNFSFPSMNTQVEVAIREYSAEGKSGDDIDLVMFSGCITDIGVTFLIDPYRKYKPLRKKIKEHCENGVFQFLQRVSKAFPNAKIVVIGYYPMVSKKSDSGRIFNTVLEGTGYPRFSKPFVNNFITKQFFKILHARLNKRSRIWLKDSNRAFRSVIDRINSVSASERLFFIESPIDGETCFETKNTLLWRMGKKGRSEDAMYDTRKIECSKAIQGFKDVDLDLSMRYCELAGIAHPNQAGAKAYADAIIKTLNNILTLDQVKSTT